MILQCDSLIHINLKIFGNACCTVKNITTKCGGWGGCGVGFNNVLLLKYLQITKITSIRLYFFNLTFFLTINNLAVTILDNYGQTPLYDVEY